jgi:selenide,water dikinase
VTADFITPVVDDPVAFGAIAAANSLSDVYAMGGEPLLAVNLAGFPREALDLTVLAEIQSAAAAVVHEAGAITVGGHSIDDPELKFGLSVVGRVHPDAVVRNRDGRPGDLLYLTKALGVGIVTTAHKRGEVDAALLDAAVTQMRTTNRAAANAMRIAGVNAATDVTGFGLLGHLHELSFASGLAARIDSQQVPTLNGVLELAEAGVVPGGTRRNLDSVRDATSFPDAMPEAMRLLLADAQTSGGLLLSVPVDRAPALESALAAEGVLVAAVGQLEEGTPGRIRVL